jgi:Flp pilus assembly pilin Flp
MVDLIRRFSKDDRGAVTVDWVVLTASVVSFAVMAYIGIKENTIELSDDISLKISEANVE